MTDLPRSSALQLKLASEPLEIEAAQALRYSVFYEELGAIADEATRTTRRDVDAYDRIADHLIVLDHDRGSPAAPFVAGCYRLLRRGVADRHGGLYTANEFDLSVFERRSDEVMELGRSCVHADYRNGHVMQLLWGGIADYIFDHGVGIMLGCASLPGRDPERLAPALAYLHKYYLAPPELRPRANASRYVPLARGAVDPQVVRSGKAMLPPLLKAYLRMGGLIGDGAVVDEQFNTTDVCLVLPTERVNHRYLRLSSQSSAIFAAVAA